MSTRNNRIRRTAKPPPPDDMRKVLLVGGERHGTYIDMPHELLGHGIVKFPSRTRQRSPLAGGEVSAFLERLNARIAADGGRVTQKAWDDLTNDFTINVITYVRHGEFHDVVDGKATIVPTFVWEPAVKAATAVDDPVKTKSRERALNAAIEDAATLAKVEALEKYAEAMQAKAEGLKPKE